MIKKILKYISIAMFAFTSTFALAGDGYTVKMMPASMLMAAANASSGETNIVVINYIPNETINQTAPIAATIESMQSAWTKHPTYTGTTVIRLVNSKGVEIFNKPVFHRSTISVRMTNNQYDVSVKEHV